MESLVTVQAAAAMLGLSENALRVRIRKGQVKAERVGARLLVIERAEVERLRSVGRAKPWALKRLVADAGRPSDHGASLPRGS